MEAHPKADSGEDRGSQDASAASTKSRGVLTNSAETAGNCSECPWSSGTALLMNVVSSQHDWLIASKLYWRKSESLWLVILLASSHSMTALDCQDESSF